MKAKQRFMHWYGKRHYAKVNTILYHTTVAIMVRARRKRARLTQGQLAQKAELSVNFIRQVEENSRAPSYHAKEKIAKALNITVEALEAWDG